MTQAHWQTTRFQIALDAPKIMGIVNVTPDSFSRVGNSANARQALQHAEQLLKEGADILDLGAESTRPGATPLSAEAEWARLAPVLLEVLRWQIPISVDTYHAGTMQKALAAGVDIINDVWALRQPGALQVVAAHVNCGVCLMHMHGEPRTMQIAPMNDDHVVSVIAQFLAERCQSVIAAGVDTARICCDPGIGFGKTVAQNFTLLAQQEKLQSELNASLKSRNIRAAQTRTTPSAASVALLLGWSRKSSLGAVTGLEAAERLVPSVVAAVLAVHHGAHLVRVHEVAATKAGLAVYAAMRKQQWA